MPELESSSAQVMQHEIKLGSVGVVVLNFKKPILSVACIRSLLMQAYPDLAILIVDNASNDGSVDLFRSEFPGIPLIESKSNLGYAGGNNLGINRFLKEAKEFIWVLNNDTVAPPDTLQHLVKALHANPQWGAAGSHIKAIDKPLSTIQLGGGRISLRSGLNRAIVNSADLPGLNYLTGCSLLIRTQALREVGLMDENYFHYWEDVDISFRMRNGNWTLGYVPDSIIYHHDGGTLATNSPRAAFFFSRSIVRFCLRNLCHRFTPILISTVLRISKALVHLRFDIALAVLRGVYQGIRHYPRAYKNE